MGFYKVWEINMGVCSRLEFDDITLINCLGYDFYINCAFEFKCNSIVILWRHVWYYYHTLGYHVINISTVIGMSCKGAKMFYEITISLISLLTLKMALFVLG